MENDGNVAANDNADTVRFIYSSARPSNQYENSHFDIRQEGNAHTYIKIVDGQLKGRFYPLSARRESAYMHESVVNPAEGVWYDKVIRPDAYGNIDYMFSDQILNSDTNFYTGTVFYLRSFDISETGIKWRFQNATSFKWNSKSYATATPNAGGESYADIDESLWGTLSDDYVNPYKTQPKYAIETVTRIDDFTAGSNQYLNIMSNQTIALSGNNSALGSIDRIRFEKQYTTSSNIGINMTSPTAAGYVTALSTSSVMFIDYAADDAAAYDKSNIYREYQMLLQGNYVSSNNTGLDGFALPADNSFSTDKAFNNLPKSTNASQTLFVRIYDRNLTEAQVLQNHFADLCYYYNIDMKSVTSATADFAQLCEAAKDLSVGLHPDGDEADDYKKTVAALNKMVCDNRAAHNTPFEGSCDEAICECGYQLEGNYTHTPEDDDKDCTTERICSLCKVVLEEARAEHTGGLATPTNRAECEVCGKEYGDLVEIATDEVYEKYKGLYYDNGHLKVFIDLNDLNAAGSTVKLSDNPTVTQLSAAKLVIGDKISARNDNGTHYFVKSVGGELAGRFFLLGAEGRTIQDPTNPDNKLEGKLPGVIKTTSTGLLDCYTPFTGYSLTEAGIYVKYMFTPENLATQFKGILDLGASGGTDARLLDGQDEMAYSGTWGHLTLDMAAVVGGSGLADGSVGYVQYDADGDGVADYDFRKETNYNINFFKYGQSPTGKGYDQLRGYGSMQMNVGDLIQGMAVGADPNSAYGPRLDLKLQAKDIDPAGSSRHITLNMKRITRTDVQADIRSIFPNSGLLRANDGTFKGFEIKDTTEAVINLSGVNPYFIRLYDCNLTDSQLLQNHFADLCYYYQLDGTDELRTYGSFIMNDAFYADFTQIRVGADGSKSLAQDKIDAALAIARSLSDTSDLKRMIMSKYETFVRSSSGVLVSQMSISNIIDAIDEKILAADSITATGDALAIINNSKAQLNAIKNNVQFYKSQVDGLNELNSAIASEIASVNSSLVGMEALENWMGTATKAQLFELLAVLDKAYDVYSIDATISYNESGDAVTVSAAEAAYKSALAKQASADVSAIYNYMMSATANTAVSVDSYIKFAFMQVRALDFAGSRAVFVVDDAAINAGFVSGQQTYTVASYGFIMAPAAASIADITVDYDSATGSVTATDGVKVVSTDRQAGKAVMNSRYAVTDDARAQALLKTGISGSVYSIENQMKLIGASDMKNAYQAKYMYRIYMVFEGEGTTFIKYADVYSRTLESSAISLYDIANASVSQVTDNRYLLPELYISKVIYRVTGQVPEKD